MDGWYARASGWCRWLELLARCTVLPEKCQRARHLMFLRACGGCRRLPCLRPRVVPTTLVYLCLHVFLLLVVCSSLDFYTILGVPRNAEKAAIKKAYHKLALDLHPDKNDFTPGSAEAEEAVRKFIEVATAYEVLSDPARRKRYDTLGPDAGDANSGGGRNTVVVRNYEKEPFDLHLRFNGGVFMFKYTKTTPKRMGDLRFEVPLTLEDLYRGKTVVRTISRHRMCPHCAGTGAAHADHIHKCTLCDGTGRAKYLNNERHDRHAERDGEGEPDFDRFHNEDGEEIHGENHEHHRHDHRPPPLFQQIIHTKCHRCEGTGSFVEPEHKCPVCGGDRTVMEPKSFTLVIPPGASNLKFKFPGDGGQAYGHETGDVFFAVTVVSHPRFTLNGVHLKLKLEVSLVEALVGFTRNISHLDGRTLSIVHDIVTSNGRDITLEGEGMPLPPDAADNVSEEKEQTNNKTHGNLVVTFDIIFPRRLTAAQKDALRTVMDDEDISMLEDVIRLAAAGDDLLDFQNEKPFTRWSNVDETCPNDPLAVLLYRER